MGNPASLCSVLAGASAEGCRGGARALRGHSSPEARVRAGGEGELLKLPSLFPPLGYSTQTSQLGLSGFVSPHLLFVLYLAPFYCAFCCVIVGLFGERRSGYFGRLIKGEHEANSVRSCDLR